MDGMIGIYKEKGYTSHDVVARMRGILKIKKIGHTGTLDPEAEGVLPVAIGAATKLCDMFSDRSKTYRAVIRLGISTDTEDMTGTVTAEDENWKGLTDDKIISAVDSFAGEYEQIPPMYSALKVDGHKLYEYARKGIEIERKPRLLNIYDIKTTSIDLPWVSIEVTCSKGTYIRTLSKDIGAKLSCNACMQSLLRTRVSDFCMEDAITLAELEKIRDEGRLAEYIKPVYDIYSFLDSALALEAANKRLINGNSIPAEYVSITEKGKGDGCLTGDFTGCVRMSDHLHSFIGIYRYSKDTDEYIPEKLFFVNNGGSNR
ncbi:MAG: tRNA pseudouridine(55) synthase TruB [Lachnospiraceae bacterium]|nr:tRNA pseudouridine(55) synthase TruB [Lachnospiraceae bacterium]